MCALRAEINGTENPTSTSVKRCALQEKGNETPSRMSPLATTDKWKDKATGDAREITEWHRVVLYRRLAEITGEYLTKGSAVYIEGRLRTRKWQDKDGKERSTTEIEGNELKMLGGKPTGSDAAKASSTRSSPTSVTSALPPAVDDYDYPF